jgi:hypothetical protein
METLAYVTPISYASVIHSLHLAASTIVAVSDSETRFDEKIAFKMKGRLGK